MTAAEKLTEEGTTLKKLHIADGLNLPPEILTETTAIVAKRRVGKSFTARKITEQLIQAGLQVVIADPKGDWWGIRSAADGKAPGLSIHILGGEHGDVPLEAPSGELVAKLVVEERVSLLLDLSHFRKSELAKFVTDFAENLYRLKAQEKYRSPMLLVLDEADAMAPQKPQHGEERMLGSIEDIVRRGGQRGIGCMLITQRTAVLNKNVLTQAQLLVALRTIAPQDLKAMDAWIDVHGTTEQRAELMASLPSLPKGDAWFWSPGWPTDEGIFKRVHVDLIETFDSGATPKPGEKRIEPKQRADVDVDALRRQMAETVERAAANDPKLLKAKVAQLEAALKKAEAVKPAPAPKVEVKTKTVERFILKPHEVEQLGRTAVAMAKQGETLQRQAVAITDALGSTVRALSVAAVEAPRPPPPTLQLAPQRGPTPVAQATVRPRTEPAEAGEIKPAHRRVLEAIAMRHPHPVTKAQLATIAVYKARGGGFKNNVSFLCARGLIARQGDALVLTDQGVAFFGADFPKPQSPEAVRELWRSKLKSAPLAIFDAIIAEYPRPVPKESLAQAFDYEPSAGGFKNIISHLAARGIVQRVEGGLRANPELFE